MYRCKNCGNEFITPLTVQDSYESYYGVSSNFGNSTTFHNDLCPRCESDEIEEEKVYDVEISNVTHTIFGTVFHYQIYDEDEELIVENDAITKRKPINKSALKDIALSIEGL